MSRWLQALPRTRSKGVKPSDPLTRALSTKHLCSGDDRVIHGDKPVQAGLGTQLQRPEEATNNGHADFDSPIALGVVRRRLLRRDGPDAFALDTGSQETLLDQSLQRGLVVGF